MDENTLYKVLAEDPLTAAIFEQHGYNSAILASMKIVPTEESTIKLATSVNNGLQTLTANIPNKLIATVEDQAELAHHLVHAIDEHIKNEHYSDFIIDPQQIQYLDQQVITSSLALQRLYKTFEPLYAICFNEKKASKKYLDRIIQAKKQLNKLTFTPEEQDILNKIRTCALELKCNAYLVGGCLRDKLLGIENHDLDFMVTTDDLERFVSYVVQKYSLRKPVHLERSDAFTMRIGEMDVDLIDAKKVYTPLKSFEETSLEGDEEFTIALDDSFRRDLTINAIMYDLKNNRVLDPTKRGFKDLEAGVINSIIDPYVKYRINAPDMLRAMRFAAIYNFTMGPEMLNAMRTNSEKIKPRDKGGDISVRRIRRELRKAAKDEASWERMKRFLAETKVIDYIADDVLDVEQDRIGTSPKEIKE